MLVAAIEVFFTHGLDHAAGLVGALHVDLVVRADRESGARLQQLLMEHVLVAIVVTDSGRLNAERIIAISLRPVMVAILALALVDFNGKLIEVVLDLGCGRFLLLE